MKIKTHKTQVSKGIENTCRRNFFQKALIVFAFIAFMAFSNSTYAQQWLDGHIDNQTSCYVTVEFWDNIGPTMIYSAFCPPGTTNTGCQGGGTLGAAVTVILQYQNCPGGLSIAANGGSNITVQSNCGGQCTPNTPNPPGPIDKISSSLFTNTVCGGGFGTTTDVTVVLKP